MLKFKIYRTTAALEMSTWEKTEKAGKVIAVNKAIMEVAPSLPTASKGQPKPGEKRYDYEKRLKISFNPTDMLVFAYNLQLFVAGVKLEKAYTKYGDLSKVDPTKAGKKTLTANLGDNGAVNVTISQPDGHKVSITIDKAEAWALAKWFENTYSKFFNSNLGDAVEDGE